MRETTYILKSDRIAANCAEYVLNDVPHNGKWQVHIRRYIKRRSLAQNRLLHLWLGHLEEHTGYTRDELRWMFMFECFEPKEVTWNGKTKEFPRSTTSLTTLEFTHLLEYVQEVAHRMNVALPRPEEYEYAMTGEVRS